MRTLIASALGVLLLGCAEEKTVPQPAVETTATTATVATTSTVATTATTSTTSSDAAPVETVPGTFAGQVKVGQADSMFNYVGAESGDFAPMRFRNDSEAGKKILAACANDDLCEFTGSVEWLDETPPPDASAIGRIVTVESVKRLPPDQ
ncbi:MAG TPA: hypothetical protein VF787_16540 [Thermoanaerobaculia bacterium]